MLGGVVVASAARRAGLLNEINKLVGANLGPQEAWLVLRGIEDAAAAGRAPVRERGADRRVAGRTAPGGACQFPGPARRTRSTRWRSTFVGRDGGAMYGGAIYGGMISFDLRDAGRAEVFRFMEALRLVQPATTLGDVYSAGAVPGHVVAPRA